MVHRPNPPLQPCRYLEESGYCAFYDHALRGNEDIRCYPGGWDCYEEPGGVAYMGRWVDIYELFDIVSKSPVSEYMWPECEVETRKPYWVDLLTTTKSQIVDASPGS